MAIARLPGNAATAILMITVQRDGRAKRSRPPIAHAAFSPDGSLFIWTERIGAPRMNWNLLADSYRFNVSKFVDGDPPHLADTRSFVPGNQPQGGEVESIAADDGTIAFHSTFRSGSIVASRIYTMDIETGAIRELTHESFAQSPRFAPRGQRIVYMTGDGADIFPFSLQGADWWIMDFDGSRRQRLTFMNKRNHPQSKPDLAGNRLKAFLSRQFAQCPRWAFNWRASCTIPQSLPNNTSPFGMRLIPPREGLVIGRNLRRSPDAWARSGGNQRADRGACTISFPALGLLCWETPPVTATLRAFRRP